MEAKAHLLSAQNANERAKAVQEMQDAIEAQANSVRAEGLRLSLVEFLSETDVEKAKQVFSATIEPQIPSNSATLHRLHARWWACKSKLEPNMRRIALREAITLHRSAGCPRAAKSLESQLHLLL